MEEDKGRFVDDYAINYYALEELEWKIAVAMPVCEPSKAETIQTRGGLVGTQWLGQS